MALKGSRVKMEKYLNPQIAVISYQNNCEPFLCNLLNAPHYPNDFFMLVPAVGAIYNSLA
jgi:hypothetical protein